MRQQTKIFKLTIIKFLMLQIKFYLKHGAVLVLFTQRVHILLATIVILKLGKLQPRFNMTFAAR